MFSYGKLLKISAFQIHVLHIYSFCKYNLKNLSFQQKKYILNCLFNFPFVKAIHTTSVLKCTEISETNICLQFINPGAHITRLLRHHKTIVFIQIKPNSGSRA